MRNYLTTLAALLVALTLTAAPVTKDAARQKALQFLTERGSGVAAARGMQPIRVQLRDGAAADQLYVFNVGQQEGFVIVSGDDCTGDLVLGYADSGEITTDNMPDNMRAWLQGYADQIKWMQEHGITNNVAGSRTMVESATRQAVSPSLTTLWDQDEPYNNSCPKYAKNAGGSYYTIPTVTGCVATATAQVMYYQAVKHGIHSTTTSQPIPEYATTRCLLWNKAMNAIGYVVEEKPTATINWDDITAGSGVAPTSDKAKAAVALLMEYIGAGVQMNYGTTELGGSISSASNVPNMLKTYFGYDVNVRYVKRNDYSYSEWLNLIYKELTTNGPVIYGGQSSGGGHSFVLDGYDQEDYFFVNWGWGGMSNGFFKLSVMHSDKQGIGGSMSQDGYCYDQDAIIDLNPINSGIDTSVRLTVDNAWPHTATYNRASTSTNFSNVYLHSAMMNKTGLTNSFDFGFGLYQDGELKQVLWQASQDNLTNNVGWSDYCLVSNFGVGLEDGVYQCIPISRLKNSETWYPDYNSQDFYIQATISGTTLTLKANCVVDLHANTFAISASPTAGLPVTVTTSIENRGTLYSGDLSIGYIVGYDSSSRPLYQVIASQQIEMTAGKTSSFEFTFTPTAATSYDLKLLDKYDKELSSVAISISAGGTPENNLTQLSSVIKNGELANNTYVDDYAIYGNTLMGSVTIRNNDSYDNARGIRLAVYDLNDEGWVSDMETTVPALIPANSSAVIDYEISGFKSGRFYAVYYCYVGGSNIYNTAETVSSTNVFYTIPGIITYNAAGERTIIKMEDAITIADNSIAAIDITGCGTKNVTPNSNPNTIYIIGSMDNPTGLENKNVIKNHIATSLTLTDGYEFYSPITFTATTATYTRQFTVGADGTRGWSTIILPFDVDQVKQGDDSKDWFHSISDTGKHFWLKEFVSESGSIVNFDFANELKANTPYIIAVPGNAWGAKWNLTNKDITFCGSNVTIEASSTTSVSGNNYKFVGTMKSESLSESYLLNAEGTAFTLSNGTVDPFRAWFKSLKMLAGAAPKLNIGNDNNSTTGNIGIQRESIGNDNYYNLNGQRVEHPGRGLYIIDGKKVIVK